MQAAALKRFDAIGGSGRAESSILSPFMLTSSGSMPPEDETSHRREFDLENSPKENFVIDDQAWR